MIALKARILRYVKGKYRGYERTPEHTKLINKMMKAHKEGAIVLYREEGKYPDTEATVDIIYVK